MSGHRDVLETMLHEVNSKCSSLKSAAAVFRTASKTEKSELLALMVQEAQELAEYLAELRQKGVPD